MNKTSSNPSVVIVAVNYNQAKYTIDCLNSIFESNYDNFHVFLIDNGSTPDVVAELKKNLVELDNLTIDYQSTNLGYVGGINRGLTLGKCFNPDFYLILNNDTLIDPNAIQSLVNCCDSHDRKAIVSGKVYNYDEKNTLQYIGQAIDPEEGLNQTSFVKHKREVDIGQYDQEMEMGMLDDIFWLMPASLVADIGGYSEYFFLYGEQNDYAFRAIKSGYKLIYTPNAKLWHKGGVSTCDGDKKAPRIEYWTTMATLKLATLHLSPEKSSQFIFSWSIRKLAKYCLLFTLRKTSFEHLRAIYLAINHFKVWNVIRFKDNGYNPFNNK
jgi:GT2 family glycosyltransferase